MRWLKPSGTPRAYWCKTACSARRFRPPASLAFPNACSPPSAPEPEPPSSTRWTERSSSPRSGSTASSYRPRQTVAVRPAPALGRRGGRIRPDHDGVRHADHLVDRQVGARGVLPDRLGAGGLVDADRPDRTAALLEHVAADPANVVGHLLV